MNKPIVWAFIILPFLPQFPPKTYKFFQHKFPYKEGLSNSTLGPKEGATQFDMFLTLKFI